MRIILAGKFFKIGNFDSGFDFFNKNNVGFAYAENKILGFIREKILNDILINSEMQQMDNGVTNMEGIKYATIIVATVPILCVYPFIQKYFAQGVMIGAVKE